MKINIIFSLFLCFSIHSMEFDSLKFDELVENFEREIYSSNLNGAPFNEKSTESHPTKNRSSSRLKVCEKCNVLLPTRSFKRHLEFCQMDSDEYRVYEQKLKQHNRLLYLQSLNAGIPEIIPVTRKTVLRRKRFSPSFICKLCQNDESKTLNSFKKHLCFNHNISDIDIRPYQMQSTST